MILTVRDVKLFLNQSEDELPGLVASRLKVRPSEIVGVSITRKSVDARKKNDIHFNLTLSVNCQDKTVLSKNLQGVELEQTATLEELPFGSEHLIGRVVVVGAGPCGLFAAYMLALNGYRPLIVEMGSKLEQRKEDVDSFLAGGAFNPLSNIVFGEGGAGTFSDGKLTTRTKDPRSKLVLELLVKNGAPPETAYLAKPHIGTDLLLNVILNIRQEIMYLGGEYLFNTTVSDILVQNGRLEALVTNRGQIQAGAAVLATGSHGSRGFYEMLLNRGLEVQPKAFAVGVRIEHSQQWIDAVQFGDSRIAKKLGSAEYALTAKDKTRGVYTFCMCPGGEVICASSEEGGLVVNGMSRHARDGKNSNSALIVQVSPDDFGTKPLDGFDFARMIERKAFIAGGGGFVAPCQTVGAFAINSSRSVFGDIKPSYKRGVRPCNFNDLLPGFVTKAMLTALPQMSKQLRGFDSNQAVMTGVETRTSSPLRILRTDDCQAAGALNLYPAGEGSGYAGGIVSAAVDGIRAAQSIMSRFTAKE